ncbi:MAG TPA: PhoX family phosphatase [Acidimicrobiales bacterium]|nr:PhoX family phosphatase [Acidimicrobiales bacterium]
MLDSEITNPTDNPQFQDVLDARLSRRSVLGGGVAAAAFSFFGTGIAGAARPSSAPGGGASAANRELLAFRPVPLGFGDEIVVPKGYTATAFLPWGTPILPGAGSGTFPTDAEDQEKRIGLGHDGMWFFPTGKHGERGLLCINHEYGTDPHITNGTGIQSGTPEMVAISQAVHGISVVEIERVRNEWRVVMGPKNRRVTGTKGAAVFTGPAAGSALLENPADNEAAGTLNNCGNGKTPWGTYLTCEENFNGYFGTEKPLGARTESEERYGLTATGFGYRWHLHDQRFDLRDPAHVNEANRYGWIVEIDPMAPSSPIQKHTALGRFKHENVELVEAPDGRVVAYMGDDQADDYVYRYVSARPWRHMRSAGVSPLSDGTLSVARFDADGTGRWLPLELDPVNAARTDDGNAPFADMAELVVNVRLAADALGATKMDRPEWVAANPVNGDVYFTCTNNTGRTSADAANPRTQNRWGHIIKFVDPSHTASRFDWDIFLLAGPAGSGATIDPEDAFGSPDGLWIDESGRMYIQTDGAQPEGANDQMLVADPRNGEIRRFLTGVPGCEVTGITPAGKDDLFVNIQHPGNGDPGTSSFPDGGGSVPRDCTVVITRG